MIAFDLYLLFSPIFRVLWHQSTNVFHFNSFRILEMEERRHGYYLKPDYGCLSADRFKHIAVVYMEELEIVNHQPQFSFWRRRSSRT